MAAKPKTGGSSAKASIRPSSKHTSKPSSASKSKPKSKASAPRQHKPAPLSAPQKQKAKKKRIYTDKELGLGPLNGIVPAGIQKRPNAKKGKKFVEDRQQMDLIMKMVMAEKEGNIESKMMKARQMEEIREARRQEMERRAEGKREGLEERKRNIKEKGKKRKSAGDAGVGEQDAEDKDKSFAKKAKKRVSFG